MKKLYKIRYLNIVLLAILTFCILSVVGFAQEEKVVLKLGHHHTVGGLVDILSHKFKELAGEKSNGLLQIDIYPGAQLGQEKEACEGVLMGTLQITGVSPSFYSETADGFGIDVLPFLYSTFEQANQIFNESSVGKELDRRLLEKGGRILGWMAVGPRDMLFVKKEVKTLEEFKGLKMRSPESEIWIEMFRGLGARPTPITWGECYTALQTGVVDGMESPPTGTIDMKFYEVTKYCLLTHHMFADMILVINEKLFQELPEDMQKVVIEAGKEAIDYANQLAIKYHEDAMDFLKEEGMKFNELADEELSRFKEAMIPMVDKWAKEHNATDLVEMIRELTK